MRAVLGREMVGLCQRGAALDEANAAQDCVRRGIFSAGEKPSPLRKALLKSHGGALRSALVLEVMLSEEGGKGYGSSARTNGDPVA